MTSGGWLWPGDVTVITVPCFLPAYPCNRAKTLTVVPLGAACPSAQAAMHRLWFCIKSAPGVSYMRIKLMCRFCFIRIKPAYFFVTDYVRLLVSKLPLGAAARLVACARFPLNWVQVSRG